ncbi:hypothetical protein N644_2813 [Lactiplantibacillus paraplantarum]|nr:hypothetical protein N644_2813 [Lactiplantibacillus paraplantarum]
MQPFILIKLLAGTIAPTVYRHVGATPPALLILFLPVSKITNLGQQK